MTFYPRHRDTISQRNLLLVSIPRIEILRSRSHAKKNTPAHLSRCLIKNRLLNATRRWLCNTGNRSLVLPSILLFFFKYVYIYFFFYCRARTRNAIRLGDLIIHARLSVLRHRKSISCRSFFFFSFLFSSLFLRAEIRSVADCRTIFVAIVNR